MAITFYTGETVICSCEVRDSSGDLADPATSMKITISNNDVNITVVADQSMTKDGVGLYHYDWASSASNVLGKYTVYYKATDSTRVTITQDTFILSR